MGGPHHSDRRVPGCHQHPGRGGEHGAGPVAARDRAVRHLPHRELDARPAGPRVDALGHQVRDRRRHAGLRRRCGHLFRAAARLRTAGRGRQEGAGRRGDHARAGGHGDGRDLPVHARAESRHAPPRLGGRPGPPAHAAGLGGDAARQGRARRGRSQLVRRVPARVPGGRGPGPAAQIRPAARGGARADPHEQLERRRQHRGAAVRTVHHPGRRPDPFGRRHPEDRAEVGGRHAGGTSEIWARCAWATPCARAPP